MSIVPKETIEVIAQSIGVNNLASDVLPSLASDVEYRILEIMQEAIKCMRHSRRTALTAEDVDCALNLRNVEPIYGFASGDPVRFKRAAGHKDLFYIDDQSVEFKDVIETPLPKAPLDTTVMVHWLAVEGVQPAIPENAPTEGPSDSKQSEYKEDRLSVDVKIPIKHVLSRELQLYFEKITELTMSRSSSILFNRALVSLATDSGLHPLVPYFTYFVADEVARNLNNLVLLFALMRLVCSLLQNVHLHIEPYLHQLMSSVMTCLVAKRLGNKISDNHWELRNFTAKLVGSICKRYGHVYHNLQPRVTRTLLHAFLDPTKALPQHYGAIQGLVALGPAVVRLLVLPNLEPYLQLLHSEMQLEKQKNEMKRREAWCVYGALQVAAGLCIYDGLKVLPNLVPLQTHVIWKSNVKVLTKTPNKRKVIMDNLTQQPPLKKIASGVRMGVMASNALTADMQGTIGGYTKNLGNADSVLPSTQRQLPNETVAGSSGRRELADTKTSNISAQAWNKCADAGHLLPLLYEHFGESILAFIPESELSFFL